MANGTALLRRHIGYAGIGGSNPPLSATPFRRVSNVTRRSAVSCLLGVLGTVAACAGPGLRVDTDEADAALYVDGRAAGLGAADLPFRFYGTSSITAVPVRRTLHEDVRAPVRTLARVEPPAPQWLFPIDFFVEALRRGFASAPPVDVVVALPTPTTSLASGTRPANTAELRTRAEQAQRER